MKILFVWTGVTSYMADCWHELQRQAGVELKVVVEDAESGKEFDRAKVLEGLDDDLTDWCPDVVFAVGWHSELVRRMVTRADWKDVPKICCFDMPWRWGIRCLAARFVLRPFLRNYVAAYVPGETCARYARWLKFPRVHKGLFSIDMRRFEMRSASWTRADFLYVGRHSPEKRLDLIRKAHARYRDLGGTWGLDIFGGPNFVSPGELPRIYARHACLVLASEFDPWPLVALEAKAAGCDVILSDRCGNRLELACQVARYGDVDSLAEMMLREELLFPVFPRQNLEMWDSPTWARRTLDLAKEAVHG